MWYLYYIFTVFFYFKQKTAYEMRISDWSSDVCSSDLVQKFFGVARARSRLHAEAAVSANLALPLLGRAFRMGGICPALSREPNARRRIRPFRAAIGAVQIGRASCRAGVCQYV